MARFGCVMSVMLLGLSLLACTGCPESQGGTAKVQAVTNVGCTSQGADQEPEALEAPEGLDNAGADYPGCTEEAVEFTVDGTTLTVTHVDAAYNCCIEPNETTAVLTVEGQTLNLVENATVANPCDCLCCTDVEATVTDLAPGTYTVNYCWEDDDAAGQECETEDIVIE